MTKHKAEMNMTTTFNMTNKEGDLGKTYLIK